MEKTIRELCKRVAATNSLDTGNDAIIAYQDLIGHATMEENQEISNTPELVESFYKVYGVAYGTCAAIKFYLNNSDKIADMQCDIEEYKAKAEKEHNDLVEARQYILELEGRVKECKRDMDGTLKQIELLDGAISERDAEIVQLKAKLFDLITKEA